MIITTWTIIRCYDAKWVTVLWYGEPERFWSVSLIEFGRPLSRTILVKICADWDTGVYTGIWTRMQNLQGGNSQRGGTKRPPSPVSVPPTTLCPIHLCLCVSPIPVRHYQCNGYFRMNRHTRLFPVRFFFLLLFLSLLVREEIVFIYVWFLIKMLVRVFNRCKS